MSIAIVGSGIVGTALAYHLTQVGVAVTIFDSLTRTTTATSWSFACLNTYGHHDKEMVSTRLASISYQKQIMEELGASQHVHLNGTLRLALTDDSANTMQVLEAVARECGVSTQDITPKDVRRLEPGLREDLSIKRAILVEPEGWSDALEVRNALLSNAYRTGLLTVRNAIVDTINHSGEKVIVTSSSGMDVFSKTIVCAGISSLALLSNHYTATSAIHPHPGVLCVMDSNDAPLEHVIYFDKFHLRPFGGAIMLGMHERETEYQAFITEKTRRDCVNELVQRASAAIAHVAVHNVVDSRVSVRSIPSDGRPICGFVDQTEQIGVMVMHGGVTLAPYLAKLFADQILHNSVPPELIKFAPGRLLVPSTP